MAINTIEICIVGLGPRGLSVLERLCANAAEFLPEPREAVLHVVDPHLGAGSQVWRSDQPAALLMNTVTSQVTMFADESIDCVGPIVPGPSLYEWAQFISLIGPLGDLPAHVLDEARSLGPDDYPSRAFYGHYLRWVLAHVSENLPTRVRIVLHSREAVGLADGVDGRQVVTLDVGEQLPDLDAVVLAQGHLPAGPAPRDDTAATIARHAGEHGLLHIPPANPADVDLDPISPRHPTLLRGMGLNFFDYVALLTSGRGGEFVRADDGRLRYRRSGYEPVLIAGSRRGVPHHARGENQKGASGRHEPLFVTASVIAGLRAAADAGHPADLAADVWPLIDREVRAVYYATDITERLCRCDAEVFLRHFVALHAGAGETEQEGDPFAQPTNEAENALLERFEVSRRWDWATIACPHVRERFDSNAQWRSWLLDYLERDVQAAKQGNVHGPLKAALDVLRDLRNEVRLIVDHGGLSGDSYRDDLQGWYTPLNAFVSIGPPVQRTEELIALIEAGALEVVGPGLVVGVDGPHFTAAAPGRPDSLVKATALIEARLPETDIRTTADPLLRSLLASGDCRPHRIAERGGGEYTTGGLAVTRRPYHLLDARNRSHPRRFAFGVPTETVHWVTAAGIRPGVNSVIIADADAIARSSYLVATRGLGSPQPQR